MSMIPAEDIYKDVTFSDHYIREEINNFNAWFIHVDFGNGIVTRSTAWPDAETYSTEMGVSKFDYIVKPNLPNLQGKRVLELGCNNGLNAIHMCRLGAKEVIGIDSSEHWNEVIKQAHFVRNALQWRCQQEYNITYYDHDMADLPNLDLGKFDMVIALNCLYYLPEKRIEEVMQHVSKIADTFLIQCNIKDQSHLGERPYPNYMKKTLLANGFKYVRVDKRWSPKLRKGLIPQTYGRPVVVGTNDDNYCSSSDSPWD